MRFFVDVLMDSSASSIDDLVKYSNKMWSRSGESLWIGEMPVKLLDIDERERVNNQLTTFFKKEYYKIKIEETKVDSGGIIELDLTCKSVHLLKEYLKNRSFRDPICTHYNPRLGTHVVHPGGTRQIILDLFHDGDVVTYYFNTRNFQFDFMKKFKKITNLTKLAKQGNNIALVPDHGTIIPHILKLSGISELPQPMIEAHNRYKSRLLDPKFKIYSNEAIDYLEPWLTKNKSKAAVEITFKSNMDLKNKLKATYLMLGGINYSDTELEVRISNET